ncbi:chlorite dismutase family protein, partial [Lonsdalea populi]|uniref:chlorite dismutase family protein n=1 Tax=Lonsdalea populi TaxID=1172565 RepID=UPI001C6562FA
RRRFALGDYEWLLSFEADDLHDLVDMMRHLRYSDARLHVRDDAPLPHRPPPRGPRGRRRTPGLIPDASLPARPSPRTTP